MKLKIVLTILLAGSSFTDQRSTMHVFRGGWHELNPIYGAKPSGPRLVGEHTAIDLGTVLALWRTKGRLGKVAKVAAVGSIADNTAATVHNYRLPEHPLTASLLSAAQD